MNRWTPAPPLTLSPYLALPQIEYQTEWDALTWWEDNAKKFPNLSVMARQYLGCPATLPATDTEGPAEPVSDEPIEDVVVDWGAAFGASQEAEIKKGAYWTKGPEWDETLAKICKVPVGLIDTY